jgi:hypothetical protein
MAFIVVIVLCFQYTLYTTDDWTPFGLDSSRGLTMEFSDESETGFAETLEIGLPDGKFLLNTGRQTTGPLEELSV